MHKLLWGRGRKGVSFVTTSRPGPLEISDIFFSDHPSFLYGSSILSTKKKSLHTCPRGLHIYRPFLLTSLLIKPLQPSIPFFRFFRRFRNNGVQTVSHPVVPFFMLSYARKRVSLSENFMGSQKRLERSLLEDLVLWPQQDLWCWCLSLICEDISKGLPHYFPILYPQTLRSGRPVSLCYRFSDRCWDLFSLYFSCGEYPRTEAQNLSTWNDPIGKEHPWVFFDALKNLSYLLKPCHRLVFIMNLFWPFYTISFSYISPFSGLSPQEGIQLIQKKLYEILFAYVKNCQVSAISYGSNWTPWAGYQWCEGCLYSWGWKSRELTGLLES